MKSRVPGIYSRPLHFTAHPVDAVTAHVLFTWGFFQAINNTRMLHSSLRAWMETFDYV